MQAFEDKIALACFPEVPSVQAWWEANNEEAIATDKTACFLKITDTDKVIAYGKWTVTVTGDASIGGDDTEALPSWLEGSDKELCNAFFGALTIKRKAIIEERPHY